MRLQVWLIKVAVLIEYKCIYINLCKELGLSLHDILTEKNPKYYEINMIWNKYMK